MTRKRKIATILQPVCEHYRTPFYNRLGDVLAESGVSLRVVHGQPRGRRGDALTGLSRFSEFSPNLWLGIGERYVVLQSGLRDVLSSDLTIVQQNSANLLNYVSLLRRSESHRLAFWGHGRRLQAPRPNCLRERIKRWYSKCADHWFAYTKVSVQILLDAGFPGNRITCVNNAIDTREDSRCYREVSSECIRKIRDDLNVPASARVGIACGRLYRAKRTEFLLRAAGLVKKSIADFHLIVIGEGETRPLVTRAAAASGGWIHDLGARTRQERIAYFKIADVQLAPGAVGLGILDSFAFETPLFTTDIRTHGPEIAYLESERNGVVTPDCPVVYAEALKKYLTSPELHQRFREACVQSARTYCIEAMVQNFASGVQVALGLDQ